MREVAARVGPTLRCRSINRSEREVLAARGLDTDRCGLAFFSAAGFSDSLRTAAERGGVLLVGLDELYGRAVPTGFVP